MSAGRRNRRRLSRTLSRARFVEYGALLDALTANHYRTRSLEQWLDAPDVRPPLAILRHDVDQHPRSALLMLEREADRGMNATWYFRWRTADARVIAAVRAAGGEVGLHYETLTRLVKQTGRPADDALIEHARALLRDEIARFAERFGAVRSACAHGDTSVPGVNNAVLLAEQDARAFGIDYDANFALRGHPLGQWLTDRSVAEGRWKDGVDPATLLARRVSPMLILTHPNNWASGPGLWGDRMLRHMLPGAIAHPIRTGADEPPPAAQAS